MSEEEIPFLGTGWGFPPQFSAGGRNLGMAKNAPNVHKSILILLQTDLGERVMQEDFGGSLSRFQFEEINNNLLSEIKDLVSDAIINHETRVALDKVEVVQDNQVEGRLLVELQYTVRATNTRYNMVYPFYINEATNIN
ncbi:MAG TPA: hypothetical protein DCS93_36575 [Microscillaceae bacterium]|nr:hypothetical protein [Microscillaceae bacterium]